ncbi:MAG TPA: FecR domain-containing protein [Rhizomicrobium sp.]
MSGIVETGASASHDEIRARAAAFLLKRREYEWTDQDQAVLDAWFAEALAHRIAYLRLETAWDSADRLAILRRPADAEIPAEPRRTRSFLTGAVAAIVVTALGIVATVYFQRPGEHVYATQIGGHKTIALADGSSIELNTDTMLRVGGGENYRQILLVRGEAYFQLRHDPAHPFVVNVGDRRVVDLGTKFSIRSSAEQVQVALVEGRARFESANASSHSASALLTPGDVAVATTNSLSITSITKKSTRELADDLGWRHGVVVFKRVALGDAAAEFNRYSHDKLIVSDPAIASLTISGTFPTSGAGTFSHAAQEAFGLHVQRYGDETVISR